MDSRVGKDPVRMSLNSRYLFAFNFHHVHSLLLVLLAHVLNKIPTDPYGNYGCHASLVITTPCLCNWSGNQVFLSFHSNSLVPTQKLAIIKSGHHRLTYFTCMSNPPDVHGFPPSRQRTQKECLFFKIFVITLTLFCSTVKLRKLKCTRYNL